MKVKSESRAGKIVSEERRADDGNISPSAFIQSSPHSPHQVVFYTLKNLIQKMLCKKSCQLIESAIFYYSGLPYPDPKYIYFSTVCGRAGGYWRSVPRHLVSGLWLLGFKKLSLYTGLYIVQCTTPRKTTWEGRGLKQSHNAAILFKMRRFSELYIILV
jgi:hypothetical protein